MDANEGSNVTLSCKAIGVPTPIITWKHRGFHIIQSDKMKYTTGPDGTGTLTIANVQESDGGRWSCLATNNIDSKLSPSDGFIRVKRKAKQNQKISLTGSLILFFFYLLIFLHSLLVKHPFSESTAPYSTSSTFRLGQFSVYHQTFHSIF